MKKCETLQKMNVAGVQFCRQQGLDFMAYPVLKLSW